MPKRNKPNITDLKNLRRNASFDHSSIDVDKRTVELSFSSEEPVSRWFGLEVLSHDSGAVRLGRINNGGPLLWMHNWNEQIGVVEFARIDSDRKGRAVVRFSKSELGDEKFQDVVDGVLRHISVGYHVYDMYCDNPDVINDDELRYVMHDWEPYEISVVSIPADLSVGVGRSAGSQDPAQIFLNKPILNEGVRNMENITQTVPVVDVKTVANEARQTEHTRIKDMIALGEAYKDFGGERLASDAIRNGRSLEQLQAAILEQARTAPTRTDASLDLTPKEERSFSVLRAMYAASTGDWSNAGFERECSDAVASKLKRSAQGFFVPTQVLMARNYSVGVPSAGGHLVANELRPQSFIELLRNELLVGQLGATVLDDLVGDLSIPKQLTGSAMSWVSENGAAAGTSATFGQIGLTPKTASSNTELSRKFLQQSSIAAEDFAKQDLMRALLEGIDLAALVGTGVDSQPLGILKTTGIGSVVSGGDLTWEHIVDLETAVSSVNAARGNLSYLTNSKVRGALKKTLKADGVGGYIWQDGDAPLNSYSASISNQLVSDPVSSLIFGNWTDLVIGHWGVMDLVVDPYSKSKNGIVCITAFQDVDITVRHAESFAAITDIKV